eukprot:3563659-Pleurochrysis_carterae.AAC.1
MNWFVAVLFVHLWLYGVAYMWLRRSVPVPGRGAPPPPPPSLTRQPNACGAWTRLRRPKHLQEALKVRACSSDSVRWRRCSCAPHAALLVPSMTWHTHVACAG